MRRALPRSICCAITLVCTAAAAPESFDAAYQLGLQKMQAKQWAAARDAFQKALEAAKDRGKKADAELLRGKCFPAEGNAAARQALQQLLAIPGLHTRRDVQQRLWALCRVSGGFDALREHARKTLASPDAAPAARVNAQFEIAYSFTYERRYDLARSEFAKILAMPGAKPAQRSEAQLYMAHPLFVARQYAQARPLYERVVAMAKAAPAHAATAQARIKPIDALQRQ